MLKEAIILAGGLGTRLRSEVPDLPKCMAPVAGRSFLSYVIDHFIAQGIERFVFSLGYKYELIQTWLQEQYPALNYTCAIEEKPLGTGGGIKLACNLIKGDTTFILNGDTLFKINTEDICRDFDKNKSDCVLALKTMHSFDRYAVVETDPEGYINSFKEKQYYEKGLINGGVYLLNVPAFLQQPLPEVFSFEKDYLEKQAGTRNLRGVIQKGYFIDIGVPADYKRAQTESLSL